MCLVVANGDLNKPLKKSLETFFTFPFLIYSISICTIYEINHLPYFFFSKMTPSRSQSDDSGLQNSLEQADGSQSKSGKIAMIWDAKEHSPLHSPMHSLTSQH